jgi:hypothetical protein
VDAENQNKRDISYTLMFSDTVILFLIVCTESPDMPKQPKNKTKPLQSKMITTDSLIMTKNVQHPLTGES